MLNSLSKYLSIKEVADLFEVSRPTVVRRMSLKGIVPHKSGNKYFILKSRLSEINYSEYYWWQIRPDIVQHWHVRKNKTLSPENLNTRSKKKVWWICDNGHEHKARVWSKMRHKYFSCFACSHKASPSKFYRPKPNRTLADVAPQLLKDWDFKRNHPLLPHAVGCGSSKKVWWTCKNKHCWQAVINNRVNGNGCPICNNQIIIPGINSLNITHSKQVKLLWDFKRNDAIGIRPDTISAGNASCKVYWKCPKNKNHKKWEATVEKVILRGRGCPECSRKSGKIYYKDSLLVTHPDLVKNQWDFTKNNLKGIYPEKVSSGTSLKVSWKCNVSVDHKWDTSIHHRAVRGCGCPFCSNKFVINSNCLATTHPNLAKEWNYQRNSDCSPETVTSGSNKKVFWKCGLNNSHEWAATISQRVRAKSGCPHCHLLPESAQEIKIRFELMHIFPLTLNSNHKIFVERLKKIVSADIYVPELNLIIEFDGSYWHRNSLERDKAKTKLFRRQGMNVIRVREFPLKRITRADVISRVTTPVKEIVDAILRSVLKLKICKIKYVNRIAKYLCINDLKNQIRAESYIKKKRKRLNNSINLSNVDGPLDPGAPTLGQGCVKNSG